MSAVVRDVNIEEERFNLSVKHLQGDPWENVEAKYPPGSRHEVKVKKIMDFGVFVELEPGVEGLIHISELSTQRVEVPNQITQVGDILKVEVLNIDLEARKIGLSVKQVHLREEEHQLSTQATEEKPKKAGQKPKKEESFFGRALKASLGVKTSDKKNSKDTATSDPE